MDRADLDDSKSLFKTAEIMLLCHLKNRDGKRNTGVSPLRFAPVEMTCRCGNGLVENQEITH